MTPEQMAKDAAEAMQAGTRTRRIGETLNIGDDITVTVLSIRGNQVRIGVNAPKSVPVHREEIYQRIQKEKEAGITGNTAPRDVAEG